jgi:BirA family biotin operon repressor/biotin-[acetyl-CoA-carboxylase] ligase
MTDPGLRRPPLDTDRLAGAPWTVEVLATAGSTNALLAERARAGAGPQVLVTEHQTAGRGRLDRTWQTPPRAALTFSVLLRPGVEPERWPWLPLLAGYAVRAALPSSVGMEATLKWPNDVLMGELKVAGILVERVEGRSGPAAVIGIGLNVSTTVDELPVPTATSLAIALGEEPDRTSVLLAVLSELDREYRIWVRGSGQDVTLSASYARHCSTIGRQVRVDLPGGAVLEGTASDLDSSGRLVVTTPTGEVAVGAGDVVHVRRTDQ